MGRKKKARPDPLARIQAHRLPSSVLLDEMYEHLLDLPNVVGCFIGRKRRKGKHTKTLSITCLVHRKVADRRLTAMTRVPARLQWLEKGRGRHLMSDVIQTKWEFSPQRGELVVGPGDRVTFNGEVATAGVVLNHSDLGRALTTAAHLFPPGTALGVGVEVRSGSTAFQARLRRKVESDRLDYALLEVEAGSAKLDNLFLDRFRVGPVYTPTAPEDLNRELFILTPQGTGIQTRCRGINARLKTPNITLTGAILTDAVTLDGHSGACLVDEKRRVWGFLRGRWADAFSVFMPANALLHEEPATLI